MRIIRFMLLILALGLIAGCLDDAPVPRPLRIGWYRWPGWYPMAIAQERGLFAKNGAFVEPVLYDSYTDMLVDLAAGRIDACFNGLYEILRSGILDVKITLATDFSNGAEGLIVAPDIRKPSDLKGKRVGIQGGASGSEFVITTFLRAAGLSATDVALVEFEPEDIARELSRGLSGGYTWEPYLSDAIKGGNRLMFSTADVPGMVVDVLAVSGRAARERSADLRGFHAAWFEALLYWKTHVEESAQIISGVVKISVSPLEPMGCSILDLEANQKAFRPSENFASLYFTGRRQIEFFMELGGVSSIPDLSAMLDGSFLPVVVSQ